MLAMKPGEDPKELERRRDLWVQPQSLKGLMRMLLPEYDRACARVVPGSQCGFTAGKNAPAQTLTARLHAEECMIERKMCVRGYIDLGTYFMSVVHEVQWKVEEWAGVPPEVTTVMRALREGLGEELPSLQGRYETGYGLSDRFPIEQGLGQGCLLSPARSKLMLAVMQRTISKLCRGFEFTAAGESVPQLVYADDGLFLSNDIATM